MAAPASPRASAPLMANRAKALYPKEAAEPSATRVSMLGARWIRPRKPLTKNFWLTTITAAESSSCTRPTATGLPSKKGGRGQFHMACPMDTYISGSSRQREAVSRRLIFRISPSPAVPAEAVPSAFAGAAPFLAAP